MTSMNAPSSSPADRVCAPAPTPFTGLRDTDSEHAPGLAAMLGIPIRLLLGGIFIWAWYTKLGPANGPSVFASSILAYKLPLPDHLIQVATFGVPYTELVASILLILGLFTRASAAVIAGLLATFIGLQVSALARGLDIHCGCFGSRTLLCTGGISSCHVIQNTALLALALLVAFTPRPALALDGLIAWARSFWPE